MLHVRHLLGTEISICRRPLVGWLPYSCSLPQHSAESCKQEELVIFTQENTNNS